MRPRTPRRLRRIRPPASQLSVLFVAESFDRVKAGGEYGRDHAADEPDGSKDEDGNDQSDGVDREADVAGFGVFSPGAEERKSADGEGNDVGQDDAEESTGEGDGERLGQELEEDVAAARAQRFLYADFAGALSDGNEHDVHQADTADAQRESADEGQAES